MKIHTTNYQNTFIEVALDCPASAGEMPPLKGDKKTIANYQFEMLFEHPYEYTSDDVFFKVFAIRNEIPENEWKEARDMFFSKGQPCFRSSPLTKRYGWGVHSDANGKVALYAVESKAYQQLLENGEIKKVKAMASKRK
ncbi:MAG: DUF6157 family protein [Cytophagales bacterium]|nr:DUF6157 family protein [Cytophagales bacterium]